MSQAEGNPGMNNLARTLQSRMVATQQANRDMAEDFGIIQGDYSLLTNTYPIPIPKSDYLVCRQLTLGDTGEKLTDTATDGGHGGHTAGDGTHTHKVLIPEKMRKLKPGDRVLVKWVQNDTVVIDIVLPASVL